MSICRNTISQSPQYFGTHKFNSINDAEKVILRYRPYSEPVVICHYKVYNFFLNKMKRICVRFQIWTYMESCHDLHEGVTVCHRLNVKRDR